MCVNIFVLTSRSLCEIFPISILYEQIISYVACLFLTDHFSPSTCSLFPNQSVTRLLSDCTQVHSFRLVSCNNYPHYPVIDQCLYKSTHTTLMYLRNVRQASCLSTIQPLFIVCRSFTSIYLYLIQKPDS